MSLYVLKTSTSTSWWRNNNIQEGELFVLSVAEQHELQSELNDTFRTTDRNSDHVCGSSHIVFSTYAELDFIFVHCVFCAE